ncbi:hypothetical protein H0H93_003919, partial [Arthromyces matolae]
PGGNDELDGKTKKGFVRPDGTQLGTQDPELHMEGLRITHLSITENGFTCMDEGNRTAAEAVNDTDRVEYYRGYTQAVLEAINQDGVDIRSYFAWSKYVPAVTEDLWR